MARPRKENTLNGVKDRLYKEIIIEYDPERLKDLLDCFSKIEMILEKKQKTPKIFKQPPQQDSKPVRLAFG